MGHLILTVGIPASGKSEFAKGKEDEGYCVSERDAIRKIYYDCGGKWSEELEKLVTQIQKKELVSLMKNGEDIVCSDTNINSKTRNGLISLAEQFGYEVDLEVIRTPLSVCLERNHQRTSYSCVPDDVIIKMHTSFVQQFPIQYECDFNLEDAYVFDIDGTLARMNGRSPYEWHKVGEDLYHTHVVNVLKALSKDYQILLLSGRDSICMNETMDWLKAMRIPFNKLFMRPANNSIKDSVLKHDIFHRHIAPAWNVLGVFDDRPSVCNMWRDSNVNCFQVADPRKEF